ncbi:hypothetical protein M406DRAFT_329100 [Cryphonectria parasitica EP155]|uniref:Uncharacterized protein n=1 Tax=Cryphonectria parasitica (strain ATCC 38755 / EP155) TaxID=660469 RepID=A0A9P4Y7W9_CRYP1|nr:uncharacterized protein M406DRAFT_329100 [Cryphonectria parasitica EP155]KAF3768059.1 hypothetical protein M406DRAFT_329100 [Cryphonectria parasitica EP155]
MDAWEGNNRGINRRVPSAKDDYEPLDGTEACKGHEVVPEHSEGERLARGPHHVECKAWPKSSKPHNGDVSTWSACVTLVQMQVPLVYTRTSCKGVIRVGRRNERAHDRACEHMMNIVARREPWLPPNQSASERIGRVSMAVGKPYSFVILWPPIPPEKPSLQERDCRTKQRVMQSHDLSYHPSA